jgi:hypothetical protein
MNKYLVLYRSEAALTGMSVSEMFANTPPDQMAAGMAAWAAWHQKVGRAITDPGAPLDESTAVAGGAVAPEMTAITGYAFLQAASVEEAAALMEGHPHFNMPGSSVQILKCVPMPGM